MCSSKITVISFWPFLSCGKEREMHFQNILFTNNLRNISTNNQAMAKVTVICVFLITTSVQCVCQSHLGKFSYPEIWSMS